MTDEQTPAVPLPPSDSGIPGPGEQTNGQEPFIAPAPVYGAPQPPFGSGQATSNAQGYGTANEFNGIPPQPYSPYTQPYTPPGSYAAAPARRGFPVWGWVLIVLGVILALGVGLVMLVVTMFGNFMNDNGSGSSPFSGSGSSQGSEDQSFSEDIAAPGTTFGFGEWATVPFEESDVVGLTVTGVEQISGEQLATYIETYPRLVGNNLFFIRYQAKQLGNADLNYSSFDYDMAPVDADGNVTGTVVPDYEMDIADCRGGYFRDDPAEGDTMDSCMILFVAEGGNQPAGMSYTDYTSYDMSDQDQLTWLKKP